MSEHTAQSDHSAKSEYTAKLSITKNAKGKLICNFTAYPNKDGEPYDDEKSWNIYREVAEGSNKYFGGVDTISGMVSRARARAFGWSPSVEGEGIPIGCSFWADEGQYLLL